jgi:RNA polymerase sigma factor (sigma-70 family)
MRVEAPGSAPLRYLVAEEARRVHLSLMTLRANEMIPTRTTLLKRLKDWGDQAGWQLFFDTYWKLIYGVARKAGLTEVEAQDAVQETLLAVAKHMPTFKYDPALGSFKAWLLTMARWRIIDQLRKRGPHSRQYGRKSEASTNEGSHLADELPDQADTSIERHWEVDWQLNLLEAATNNVRRRIDPQKYQVFDCYVNKGWPAAKVAATFGLSLTHVYVAKHRITQLVKDEVARLEAEVT